LFLLPVRRRRIVLVTPALFAAEAIRPLAGMVMRVRRLVAR
jgi:hypothetical protein